MPSGNPPAAVFPATGAVHAAEYTQKWVWRCSFPHTPNDEQMEEHEQGCNQTHRNGDYTKAMSLCVARPRAGRRATMAKGEDHAARLRAPSPLASVQRRRVAWRRDLVASVRRFGTGQLEIGGRPMSALAHFADSSSDISEAREVPIPDSCISVIGCINNYSVSSSAMSGSVGSTSGRAFRLYCDSAGRQTSDERKSGAHPSPRLPDGSCEEFGTLGDATMANEQIIGQVSTPDNVAAVLGHHTAAVFGVHGHAENGFTAGVRGTHNGPIGHGVRGEAATGVFGKSNTGDGRGVSGEGKTGVFGLSTGGGHGVVGQVPEGPTAGVFGHSGPSGHGVRGEGGIGVLGTSSRTGFAAVAGDRTGAGVGVVGDVAQGGDGTAGVLGRHKAGGVGVRGEGKIGVLGKQTSPDGHGVRGEGV